MASKNLEMHRTFALSASRRSWAGEELICRRALDRRGAIKLGTADAVGFSTAKKVRSDTKIGNAPVSVGSVAIDLIKKVFGSLRGRRILLVGAGKISGLAASHLIEQGAESIAVANRTFENALGLAGRLGGHAVHFEDCAARLPRPIS